tara:strand:- start:5404 stop:6117 length:714 start_codon:yes stop_codon:yes gene_type:complete
MKIDFNTHYSRWHFKGLCRKAERIGLDALVMTGLKNNQDRKHKSLLIFPAQEVDWKAAMEIQGYRTLEDQENHKASTVRKEVYTGKALVLLPSNVDFLRNHDKRLYPLLEQVSELGGVTISLHNENNWPIALSHDSTGYIYPFDAIRIKPGDIKDIYSGLAYNEVPVAGSDSCSAKNLTQRKAFTEYGCWIDNRDKLIDVIKNQIPTKLFIHGKRNPMGIKNTVAPEEFILPRVFED